MNILAIDCYLKLTGVALNGLSEQLDLGRRQSQELPLMTERILSKNNLSWNDIDYIALTNGPGYFTGIRVGAAYATGIAYACGAKIIPVSSLELLSHSSGLKAEKILTVIYAGHGFVYTECKNYLDAGEYSHEFIISWLKDNPDCEIISDNPERTNLANLEIKIAQVKPDLISLCEIAEKNLEQAINPEELKILYYRAPQGM